MRQHSDAEWHGSLDAATIARDGYVDLGEITAAGANGPDLAGDRELFFSARALGIEQEGGEQPGKREHDWVRAEWLLWVLDPSHLHPLLFEDEPFDIRAHPMFARTSRRGTRTR